MAIQGLRNTADFDTPNGRRPGNYREMLLRLYPNGGALQKAPLTALTAVMKSEATTDPVFHWFTKQMQDRRLKLEANLDGAKTAWATDQLTVDDAYSSALQLKAGDLLYAEHTGEIMQVRFSPSAADTIDVIRGFTLASGADLRPIDYDGAGVNPFLKVIGSAFEEGSRAPDPIGFDFEELFNQCQIFRSTYGLTETAAATTTRLGSEEQELRREALEIFGMDMEMAFWFGQKATRVRNGKPLRTTAGVLSFIPESRRFSPDNGELTYDVLAEWAQDMFRYGSSEKLAFCGGTFLASVARLVRKSGAGTFNFSELGSVTQYGMKGITRLNFPTGSLLLKPHPLFSQMVGGTTTGEAFTSMDNAAVALDMANIRYRYLKGRDVKFQPKLQENDEDSRKAGWIGECGIELHHPYTHSIITGVRSGEPDPE